MKDDMADIKERFQNGASLDYMASRGEFLSAKMIAAYIGYDFVDAADIIKFDKKGRLLEEETAEAIKDKLKNHERAVIPGFYGSRPDGSIKTFPRGGSDITGALVAGAMKADVYENWTDVDGLMDKDPRKHSDATLIERLSYDEFIRISEIGDQVYHIDAIGPIMTNKVPLNIRNTNAPDKKGTYVAR